jgi:hypothetical protein
VNVLIERADPSATESRELVAEMWRELDELYGNEVATPAEFQTRAA